MFEEDLRTLKISQNGFYCRRYKTQNKMWIAVPHAKHCHLQRYIHQPDGYHNWQNLVGCAKLRIQSTLESRLLTRMKRHINPLKISLNYNNPYFPQNHVQIFASAKVQSLAWDHALSVPFKLLLGLTACPFFPQHNRKPIPHENYHHRNLANPGAQKIKMYNTSFSLLFQHFSYQLSDIEIQPNYSIKT